MQGFPQRELSLLRAHQRRLDAADALSASVAHLFEIGDQPGAGRTPSQPLLR
jgi:hypothetical protein